LAVETPESYSPIKPVSLFAVLIMARLLSPARAPLPLSVWTPAAYLWQDIAVAIVFAVFDYLTGWRWLNWIVYGLAVIYVSINVAVVRVLFSPLTPSMLRAAGGPLADSIRYYLTHQNITAMAATIAAGAVLPVLMTVLRPSLQRTSVKCSIAFAVALLAAGPYAISKVDTGGRYRNAFGALWPVHLQHVPGPAAAQQWRASPFPVSSESRMDLGRYRGAAAGRNVVLILLESTAARYWPDNTGTDPMPNLTALSAQGIVFLNAYAVYPESIKGLLSVLCSRYPAFDLSPEAYRSVHCPALPQELARAGYRTALFHSGRFMYLGMPDVIENRGFDVLEDAGAIGGNIHSSFGVDDMATVHRLLSWIDSLKPGERFFVTYLPVAGHHPYVSPEAGPFGATGNDLPLVHYLNAIHYGDRALGVVLDGLRTRGLEDKTLFVVFGDHGEAFGEHEGNFGHTQFIYDENVHVPYVIAAPGLIQESIRTHDAISLIDTSPSILDLLGFPIPADLQGTSVLEPGSRMSLFFTDYSLPWLGLQDACRKYLFDMDSARSHLYDVCADPRESADISSREPDRISAYRSIAEHWISSVH
jgi:phosphoglycerol transferase MdoB-like AlkP superfamily enzyme